MACSKSDGDAVVALTPADYMERALVQYLKEKELSALIMAMHKLQQRQLPLVLFGAGLPILPRLAGESKSYAERLFNFPNIGALSEADAHKALQDPVKAAGVAFAKPALAEIYRLTQGYPYFIQFMCREAYDTWLQKNASGDVPSVPVSEITRKLDNDFFAGRWARVTDFRFR